MLKRFARAAFFLFAGLVMLLILFHVVENWRGRRAFEKFKREVEAQGDTLDHRAMIPPPVKDEENFAMHPFFKPLFDYENPTEDHGVVWRDTKGHQRVVAFSITTEKNSRNPSPEFRGTKTADGTVMPVDLIAWQKFFRSETNYPRADQPQSPARDVLLALSKFDREFRDLEEAARRPKARFPLHYEEPDVFNMLLPHLAVVKGANIILNLRAAAQSACGQTNEAFATIKIAFKVSNSVKDEPILISHLVRIATLAITLERVAEGLAAHHWSEVQLLELESRLSEIDILAEFKHTMRGERNWFIFGGIDFLKSRPSTAQALFANPSAYSPAAIDVYSFFTGPSGRIAVPDGWFDQNKCAGGKVVENLILPLADEKSHRLFMDRAKKIEFEVEAIEITRYSALAQLLLASIQRSSTVLRGAKLQADLDEARLACALERYRMVSGQFPETIDALVPKFVPKLPTDVITGGPLKYRREADGRFVLYSVGLNGKDDGGVIIFKKGGVNPDNGDWVWKNAPAPR